MGKVIRKFVPSGAPAYMSQFTMIMLILVCMCMIMSIMSKQQESGFKGGEGMGKVRKANALGIVIGSGVFRFGSSGKARTFADNPGDIETEASQNPHMDLLKGGGGAGNTDLKTTDMESYKYIFTKLVSQFPPKSAAMTPQISDELIDLGTAMRMIDFGVVLKCYCKEYESQEQNSNLAFERGLRIIKELNRRFNVPLAKMSCIISQTPSGEQAGAHGAAAPAAAAAGHADAQHKEILQETSFILKLKLKAD